MNPPPALRSLRVALSTKSPPRRLEGCRKPLTNLMFIGFDITDIHPILIRYVTCDDSDLL